MIIYEEVDMVNKRNNFRVQQDFTQTRKGLYHEK